MPPLTSPSQILPAIDCTGLDPREVVDSGAAQPLVYLLDRAGAGFNYRYEWESVGPFSVELHDELSSLDDEDYDGCAEAVAHVRAAAQRIRPLLDPPPAQSPTLAVWLQLLVTVDSLLEWPLLNGRSETAAYVRKHVDDQLFDEAKKRLRAVFAPAEQAA